MGHYNSSNGTNGTSVLGLVFNVLVVFFVIWLLVELFQYFTRTNSNSYDNANYAHAYQNGRNVVVTDAGGMVYAPVPMPAPVSMQQYNVETTPDYYPGYSNVLWEKKPQKHNGKHHGKKY